MCAECSVSGVKESRGGGELNRLTGLLNDLLFFLRLR